MSTKQKNIPIDISYQIRKINDVSFSMKNMPLEIKKGLDKDFFNVFIQVGIKVAPKNDLIIILPTIIYSYKDEEYLNYVYALEYKVSDFIKNFGEDSGTVNIPNDLLKQLIGVAVSTGRGLIAEKTASSNLRDFYLPVVDPNNLLKQKSEAKAK